MADVNQQIKFGKDFKNFVNNTRDEFEEQMKTSAIFLQEVIFKIALKHGFEEKELRKLYQVIKLQNSKNKIPIKTISMAKTVRLSFRNFSRSIFRQRQQTLPFFCFFKRHPQVTLREIFRARITRIANEVINSNSKKVELLAEGFLGYTHHATRCNYSKLSNSAALRCIHGAMLIVFIKMKNKC